MKPVELKNWAPSNIGAQMNALKYLNSESQHLKLRPNGRMSAIKHIKAIEDWNTYCYHEIHESSRCLFCRLSCWKLKSVEVISRLHERPPAHHVYPMLIASGQGARGHGRVNALIARHIASLSLPFLFTLTAQRPELKSERRHVIGVTAGKWLMTRFSCFAASVISSWFFPSELQNWNYDMNKNLHQLLCFHCVTVCVTVALRI